MDFAHLDPNPRPIAEIPATPAPVATTPSFTPEQYAEYLSLKHAQANPPAQVVAEEKPPKPRLPYDLLHNSGAFTSEQAAILCQVFGTKPDTSAEVTN